MVNRKQRGSYTLKGFNINNLGWSGAEPGAEG